MKHSRLIPAFIFLAIVSCNNPQTHSPTQEQPHETPKALGDQSISSDLVSKRGSGDLLESLYEEQEEKSPELKDLEARLKYLSKTEPDSIESFEKYNGKNKSYYASAESRVTQIDDSVLRDKIKKLIASSLMKYNSAISVHENILKSINKKNLTLADLHIILKIMRTLPIIEQYQHTNLPPSKSMQDFSSQLDQAINNLDSLTTK
jgi:hypothetical protein